MDEDRLQALAQARVDRAAAKHKKSDGVEPDVACMAGDSCDNVPEFHIEQLDGECLYACWEHRFNALADFDRLPLVVVAGPKELRDN